MIPDTQIVEVLILDDIYVPQITISGGWNIAEGFDSTSIKLKTCN